MEVNDDSVVLKGGTGPWADTLPENGSNERIIVEDCCYGFCHGCLTCGSESIHNRNIIIRRLHVNNAANFLWLKMRPDTPQHYEYITVEDVNANIINFISINPWAQFFDLKDRDDMPKSSINHIVMKNCECECNTYFNVTAQKEQYDMEDFTFENLSITTKHNGYTDGIVKNMVIKNVHIKNVVCGEP